MMSDEDNLQELLQQRLEGINIHDSTVIIGSNGNFAVVNKRVLAELSEGEQELLRLYQKLSTREKIELIFSLYDSADRIDREKEIEDIKTLEDRPEVK